MLKHEEMLSEEDGENVSGTNIIQEIEGLIESICSIGNYRVIQRKECQGLVRRIKLLTPLLDEIKEHDEGPTASYSALADLRKVLCSAKKLLKTCSESSKIYLALEYEAIMGVFNSIHGKLGEALEKIPYDELGLSDETKEQVDLMQNQLRRAKRRTDTHDMELAMDMMVLFSKEDAEEKDSYAKMAMIKRLAKKLELQTVEDLNGETAAIRKLAQEMGDKSPEDISRTISILNKFRQLAGVEETSRMLVDDDVPIQHGGEATECQSMGIPQEFLCPITKELMRDPVIVATGQTYERESIVKWLDSDHRTCPKTGQVLTHPSVATNYALKNLISQWCEENNFRPPKKPTLSATSVAGSRNDDGGGSSVAENRDKILSLVPDLSSTRLEVQREAVRQVRLLSRESPQNRILTAECGGIPPLVQILSYPDSKIQEDAVTAVLNLSIDEQNKKQISDAGAIPAIIEILRGGNVGAKENSAAALFSLTMLDENKVAVGLSDGIPPLIDLLRHGTIRGRRDAAAALFNLCLNHMNKGRAVEGGIVGPLFQLLKDRRDLELVDEALSIALLLASHQDGRQEIGGLKFIEVLVELIREGSRKNQEGAAAVLLELGLSGSSFMLAALQFGVYDSLVEIAQNGTSRAQRKANLILQQMRSYEQIP